ncbi:hypothetical protein, partial [Bacteroides pyogenes]
VGTNFLYFAIRTLPEAYNYFMETGEIVGRNLCRHPALRCCVRTAIVSRDHACLCGIPCDAGDKRTVADAIPGPIIDIWQQDLN